MVLIAANILVVEDSLVQANMIQAALLKEGYSVFHSKDGKDILDSIINNEIDIVLLDIVLPAMDGFQLLEQILGCGDTCDIPVIMVTGLTSGLDVKRALDKGAYDYVKKPIDEIELAARVSAAFRLKTKQDLLKEYATIDKLTNMYNRSFFDETLLRIVEETKLTDRGVSLAMLDCDNFKEINDKYGHLAGDTVLASLANVINKSVKSTDIICRYGGDEFCLILMNTSLQQGFVICERIRMNIEKLKFRFGTDEAVLTASIGVTHLPPNETRLASQVIAEVDRILYAAKNNGGNIVEIPSSKTSIDINHDEQ